MSSPQADFHILSPDPGGKSSGLAVLMKLSDIKVDEGILPRSGIDMELVESYFEAMKRGDKFPALALEKDTNKVLDGIHRLKAARKLDLEKIEAEYHIIPSTETAKYYAAKLNARHGLRLKNSELKAVAVSLAEAFPDGEPQGMITKVSSELSVPDSTVSDWLSSIYQRKKWQRDSIIWKLSLLGWTQEEIAEVIRLHQTVVGDILREIPNSVKSIKQQLSRDDVPTVAQKLDLPELLVWTVALEGKSDQERFEKLGIERKVYNVWNYSECDDRFGSDYPGRTPGQALANLYSLYTKQGDLVVDPMAGSGI